MLCEHCAARVCCSSLMSGMVQGLEAYSSPRKDRTKDYENMTVGADHVISKDDYLILKMTYDLALSKIEYNCGGG
jgi:hypothetical protein